MQKHCLGFIVYFSCRYIKQSIDPLLELIHRTHALKFAAHAGLARVHYTARKTVGQWRSCVQHRRAQRFLRRGHGNKKTQTPSVFPLTSPGHT